jgi:glycosyltransferase involved in cell wall biosynthesis
MRISYLINNLYPGDGVGNTIIELSRYLLRRGHDLRILHEKTALPPDDLSDRCLRLRLEELHHISRRSPAGNHFRGSEILLFDYSVYYELAQAIRMPHRATKLFVYHGVTPPAFWDSETGKADLIAGVDNIALAREADLVVVASDFTRREMLTHGIEEDKIAILPYCIRGDRFHVRPRDLRLQKLWNLRDHFVLLYAGRMASNKRIDELVRALAAARKSGLPLKLLLVGNDKAEPYASQARQALALAEALYVVDHVVFTGSVTDEALPACYSVADLYVSASVHEGFGIPLVEAMASGKPVIAGRAASVPWVVGDGGKLVEPGDHAAMGHEIAEILRSIQTPPAPAEGPPRLCFVVPRCGQGFAGGAENLCWSWAQTCRAAGWPVHIVTTTSDSMIAWNNAFPPGEEMVSGVPVLRFSVDVSTAPEHFRLHHRIARGDSLTPADLERWVQTGIAPPALFRWLADHRDQFDFFVFAPYLFNTFLLGAPSVGDQAIAIPCLHDEAHARTDIVRRTLDRCRAIFFNTQAEKDFALKDLGVAAANCFTLGVGIDLGQRGDAAGFRAKFGLKSDFILYCGRLEEGKNVPLLIEYFRRYQSERIRKPLKLVLIGTGSLPAHDDVVHLGYLSEQDKRNALAAALALVNPSVNESFSIVLMEAWSQACPVLVHGNCPVTSFHVYRSRGGLCFRDAAEFARGVDKLRNDPLARRMGEAGRAYVGEHYHWPLLLDKFRQRLDLLRTETAYEKLALRAMAQARRFNHSAYVKRWDGLLERVKKMKSQVADSVGDKEHLWTRTSSPTT